MLTSPLRAYRVSGTIERICQFLALSDIEQTSRMREMAPLDALRTMLLTPPPEVRKTIVVLRLGGWPGFPFQGWAKDVRLDSGSTRRRRTRVPTIRTPPNYSKVRASPRRW